MKRYIVLLTALVISHFAMAQDFKPMEHNGLLYQELVFCNDVKGKIPLVIYLHGRHASGNDNQKQLSQAGVQEIDKYLRKNAIQPTFLFHNVQRTMSGTDGTAILATQTKWWI